MTVTLFYVALAQASFTCVVLIIEFLSNDEPIPRLFSLSSEQFIICLVLGLINILGMVFKTTAFLNERPGFITLVGYIGLVYAFMVDTLYLDESFEGLELFGAALILVMNVLVIVLPKKKLTKPDDVNDA